MEGETEIVRWGPPDDGKALFRIGMGLVIIFLILAIVWFLSSVGGKKWLGYLIGISAAGLLVCLVIQVYFKRNKVKGPAVFKLNALIVSLMISLFFSIFWLNYGERAIFVILVSLLPFLMIIGLILYFSRRSISFVLKVPNGFSVRLHEELLKSTTRYLDGLAVEYKRSGSSFSIGKRPKVHIEIGYRMIDDDKNHNIILRSQKPEDKEEWEMAILHIISSIDNLESYPTDEDFFCPVCHKSMSFIPASDTFFCYKCGKGFEYEEVVHSSEREGI